MGEIAHRKEVKITINHDNLKEGNKQGDAAEDKEGRASHRKKGAHGSSEGETQSSGKILQRRRCKGLKWMQWGPPDAPGP